MFFFRKAKLDTEPLPIKMSGIRLGERLLQIGADDPTLLAQMAQKIGLSGTTVVVVTDAQAEKRAKDAAAGVGALIELHLISPQAAAIPVDDGAFDVVVVHTTQGLLAALRASGGGGTAHPDRELLRDARRALRHGGRIIVVEAGPKSGLAGVLKPYKPDQAYEAGGGTVGALEAAGFRPVRLLSERDGYRFTEGLKT